MTMRVMVAGSPRWPYTKVVEDALVLCMEAAKRRFDTLTVVHGGTKDGPEAMAERWAFFASQMLTGVNPPERHPPQWSAPCVAACNVAKRPKHRKVDRHGGSICPAAGYYRTEVMFNAGVELLLVFIVGEPDKPTQYTLGLAKLRGVTTQEFRP